MEVTDSVCDSGQNDNLQEMSSTDVASDDQDHVPCSQPTEMISSTSSSNSSYQTSITNPVICLPLSPFNTSVCNVDDKPLANQENSQESSNYFIPKLDNLKNHLDKLQDENSNLIAPNHEVPSSEDVDEKADVNDDEERLLIIDTASSSSHHQSLTDSSLSHDTEENFSKNTTKDLNICLHDKNVVENVQNDDFTDQHDTHVSQQSKVCESNFSEISNSNVESDPNAEINCNGDDDKNDHKVNEKHRFVDQNISQPSSDSIIYSDSSENKANDTTRSVNAPHSPSTQDEKNNHDIGELDSKKFEVGYDSDGGTVRPNEDTAPKESDLMPEIDKNWKYKHETDETYAEITRNVSPCQIRSRPVASTSTCDKETPSTPTLSTCSSSLATLPSSSSSSSSSLSCAYGSIPPAPQHGFYDSLKLSESREKVFSDNQPSHQSFSCSEDQWTSAANSGINHNEANSAETRNSLETIKRKQKSLNDIIIRMLNDSSNKVHCSTESYVTNLNTTHMPLFLKSNSPCLQNADITQNLAPVVSHQTDNKNDLNEDANNDDDDDDNDNLEIQIDDDVEIEVADKNDGKPTGDDQSPRTNISNGGGLFKYGDEKLHHISNFSQENDFQKQSSNFIQEPNRRNYQDTADYQTVKTDKEHPRVDILEPSYLFPYDSRLYNVHLFEKFLPHAYHDYKTASHFHESGHIGSRALCNPVMKDHYSHNQDEFESDAIDLTKNTRPNTTNSGFDTFLNMKNHEAYDERNYSSVNGSEEFDKKQVQDSDRSVGIEEASFMEMNNNKIVCDNNLVSTNSPERKSYSGVNVSGDPEGKDYDESMRQDISKMEEDAMLKEGLKAMRNYSDDLYSLKEPISKSLNFSSYPGDMYHSNRDNSYSCHGYDYQNACSKSSSKYSLMADMGNSFYAYYNNAHYNGAMSLYGGIGHCLAMTDKMQQSDSKHVSPIEAEVLNLAKQDKSSKSSLNFQRSSGYKGDVNNVTENDENRSDSFVSNKMEKNVQASNFFPVQELNVGINSLEDSVDDKVQTSTSLDAENITSETEKCGNSVPDQMQINSNNSSVNGSDQSAIDSKQFQSNQSSVSTEHHKEMGKTKSIWRDKYLAEDSSLHFTNFSSISRLEQCVSSINYDKPPVDKKERMKLSADVEKELHSFRMGLKMLGEPGIKFFDNKDDFICDQSPNTSGKNKKSGSSQKSNEFAECNVKSNKTKSKSNKESKSKKTNSSDVYQDFNANNFHINGPSHPQCPENYPNDLARHASRNEQLAFNNMGMNFTDRNDMNNLVNENGKKKRGRKKKDGNGINPNAENHFKTSESSNFSEHVHNYNMMNNHYQEYQDYYNNNMHQHFRQQQQHQQMPVGYPYVPQSDMISSSILKVPESHLSAGTSPSKKKQSGDCKRLKCKNDKSKNSEKHIRNTEKVPTPDNDDIDDNESFLCNGTSLDIYLNEPKACQPSDQVVEEKPGEETDLPFTFDADQKTFTCHFCNYQVKRKGQLMKHLGGHQVFVCTHCNAKCPDQRKLEEHLLEKHPTRCGRRLCKRCHVLFRLEELEQHEVECNGEKQGWSCDLCDKKFRFLSAVKNHVAKWHKNEPSRFEMKAEDMIKKPKSKSHSEGSRNNKGIEYVDESTILDDIQIVDLPQLETSIDMNSFTGASSPNRDSSTDAGSGSSLALYKEKQAPDFSICQGNEISKTSIGNADDKKSRTFQCKLCPKFYRSMQSLKIHKQKKHGDYVDKQLEPQRPTSRQGKMDASSSEEIHHLETRSFCDYDAKQADKSDKSLLKNTSKEVVSAKELIGQDLDSVNHGSPSINFKEASSNDNTDEDASNEMPSSHFPLSDGWFQCTYESCSKKFRKLEQVQKHEERHPIDKIYKCDWPGCRKAYIHYANLYSHRSHHITAKPFVCNLCSSAYWQKCSLNSHKARVHGIKNPALVPGPKNDRQKVDRSFEACDDDSKTITSNISDSEANSFCDVEKSESGTISFTGLIQINHGNESEQLSDLNDKSVDDNNYNTSSKKKCKLSVKENINKKSKCNKSYSEKSKSKMSTNYIDSNESEEDLKRANEVVPVSKEKPVLKSNEIKSSKVEMDKSEASQASTCIQDHGSGKKKRGRKPKSTKLIEEIKIVEEKETPKTKKEEKPEHSSDFFKADGYKPFESRCVVEELLLTAKIPLSQHNLEDMTPLEVALNDLGAREVESCDDAYSGTEKTKTKRKIRTSLNYRKKSKLAKKGNQDVTMQLDQALVTSSTALPTIINDEGKTCNDNMELPKSESKNLLACNFDNKNESASDRIIFNELEAPRLPDQIMDSDDKMSDIVKSGLEFDSLSSETVANVNITKCDKFTIGNVYEFCESESEECIGSNKSSVKKKFVNKKQETKKLDLLSESRDIDDSDDNTSVDFKLSREGCKPPMTYLNRSKKKPHAPFDSSSPVSMISEESLHHPKKKQKRKLKSESSENTLNKKQKRYSSNNQINTSFENEENDSFALKKDESPIQTSNRETIRDEKDERTASQPTPAKRVSKRRKNEVEVLLEDTLSRPATADKKSSGRPSKRSELFNFDRSLVPKLEVKTSVESKKVDTKIVEQKMTSNDKEESGTPEDEVQNTNDAAALSELEGNKTIQSFTKDFCIESSEDVMETQSQPIESRLAKKRKAESLVPMFYEDGLHMKEEKPSKKNLNLQPKTESVSAEISSEICSSGNIGDAKENPVNAPSEIKEDSIKNVVPTSNVQTYEQDMRTELVSVAENPLASGPNIILKLKIREVERYTPSLQSTQESEEKSESHTPEQLNDFNENSAADISTAESKQDLYKVPNKDMTEDTDSQLSLIDSLEYLRIAERAVAASENVPVTCHSTDNMESASIDCRQAVPAIINSNNLDKQADHTYKEDDYCIEDGDDDGGFVKPSEPPSTWRNYDYDDTCYDHQSERKKFKGKSADDQEVDLNKRNLPNNEETDKLCHFPKNDSTIKESFCQDANEEEEEKRKKSEMPDEGTGSLSKNDDIPDSVSLRASLEEVEDKLYQPKNQIFDHSDVAYSDEQFRNGMESSRPISPFNHSKELSHPGSNRKDSKLSVDTLAEGQPYPNACSSSYFDYQTMAVKRSDPHPLSSLESLATLAPSAGLGGYFDSVVPPEKRLSNDLNKPPRSNNFHPEVPPPPPPHTPFPANPYRNFPSYEADLALLSANRHKSYRYNERPFDPSLAYSYDRPELHHPSYHMGSNFASPDSRFFSQFLQSADAVDQRYYMGQQGGFGDFQKGAGPPIPGDPKNKFTSTSFTSLLTGSPYSGLSDSYLSSLTPNISNPSLATNQLGNYGRGEGWANERPWTAAPPSTNDPSIQYQQHQQPSQQQHGSSRKQQQAPANDYDAHAAKKTPSSSSASVRGSGDPHFYNSYESSSPRLRNLATPGPLPSVAQSGHKRLEEAYRHAAAIMSSDYNQHHHPSLIQPTPGPATDVYGSADPMMNPAAFPSFNRYYYSAARDAVYRSQQRLAAMHHHHQQQQHSHNSSLSPFSNVNLAGFAAPGYPPDPFTPLPASTSGMPYSSKNHHYPSSRGGNGGGGKHHQNQIQPSASTGAPQPQTNSKSKSSKAILPPLGLGGMAPSFDHLNSSNFLHQQNSAIPPDPYRQSVIYNMIPKYF